MYSGKEAVDIRNQPSQDVCKEIRGREKGKMIMIIKPGPVTLASKGQNRWEEKGDQTKGWRSRRRYYTIAVKGWGFLRDNISGSLSSIILGVEGGILLCFPSLIKAAQLA
jgi:hypothetical protein